MGKVIKNLMQMVFSYFSSDYFCMVFSAYLSNQIPCSQSYISNQHLITVFSNPSYMVSAVKLRMACSAIVLHI